MHCLSDVTSLAMTYLSNGRSFMQVAAAWFFNGTSPSYISTCRGYPCVQSCPGGTEITGIAAAVAAQVQLEASNFTLATSTSEEVDSGEAPAPPAGGGASWLGLGRRARRLLRL